VARENEESHLCTRCGLKFFITWQRPCTNPAQALDRGRFQLLPGTFHKNPLHFIVDVDRQTQTHQTDKSKVGPWFDETADPKMGAVESTETNELMCGACIEGDDTFTQITSCTNKRGDPKVMEVSAVPRKRPVPNGMTEHAHDGGTHSSETRKAHPSSPPPQRKKQLKKNYKTCLPV